MKTEFWKKCCDHSFQYEEKYSEVDRAIDMQTGKIIITGSDSSGEESETKNGKVMDGIKLLD